jgi:hypothetical protein
MRQHLNPTRKTRSARNEGMHASGGLGGISIVHLTNPKHFSLGPFIDAVIGLAH